MKKLFSAAPNPLGLTSDGQIVSRQRFIRGEPPAQAEVDQFLLKAGLTAARNRADCRKKADADSKIEVWVGDARVDNFVSAGGEIIPIDIRVRGVPLPARH